MLPSPSGCNIERITKKIYTIGNSKNIHHDIISIVLIYYMSKNKENIDIDNLFVTCDKNKGFFIEAINSEKAASECYAKNDEYNAIMELNESIHKLSDLQTAVGIHYYNTYGKRNEAVRLFRQTIVQNNPLAQFYLGIYYTNDSEDLSRYHEGIELHRAFTRSEEDIPLKETNYRKDVDDIVKHTVYKHEEIVLLDFAIECAQRTVDSAAKKLEEIQHEKDTLRLIAVEKITYAVNFVTSLSDFKIDNFYNKDVLREHCD